MWAPRYQRAPGRGGREHRETSDPPLTFAPSDGPNFLTSKGLADRAGCTFRPCTTACTAGTVCARCPLQAGRAGRHGRHVGAYGLCCEPVTVDEHYGRGIGHLASGIWHRSSTYLPGRMEPLLSVDECARTFPPRRCHTIIIITNGPPQEQYARHTSYLILTVL